jgi:hypothetical protein
MSTTRTGPAVPSTDRPRVTFAVHPVAPATEPKKECRLHEAVRRTLDSDVESCSDYHATVVAGIGYQPLLAAVYVAYAEHRPLVLTPDAVWLTIAQGVAHHMAVHGERLRPRFVAHQGRLELAFECRGWVDGSPENPWPQAFASWAGQFRDHVGPATHDLLVPDFSTTGPVERAVGQVVLMDVFERYFHYRMYCVCGVPTVTLEGTPADWDRLRDKAAGLRPFDLDWWLAALLPVCDQFPRAARGDVDLPHWRDICKLEDAYGGHMINGWVANLFPYVRSFINGPCRRRNPALDGDGSGFQTFVAPPGLSRVPFTWRNLVSGRERRMEAVGGLVGVSQDPATLALRPAVGWAVREAERIDVLLARVTADHATFAPASTTASDAGDDERAGPRADEPALPPDVSAFYARTDGAELFGRGAADVAAVRIRHRGRIEPLEWNENPATLGRVDTPTGLTWHRIADLADGGWLAINLDNGVSYSPATRDDPALKRQSREDDSFAPLCHGTDATRGVPGRNPVIALSFTEWLERTLDADGRPYWLADGFAGYGDAERFTRRL